MKKELFFRYIFPLSATQLKSQDGNEDSGARVQGSVEPHISGEIRGKRDQNLDLKLAGYKLSFNWLSSFAVHSQFSCHVYALACLKTTRQR